MFELKEKLKKHQIVLTAWSSLGSPFTAEIMGNAGFDSVVVDMQHGTATEDIVLQTFQAISATKALPVARARGNDPYNVMRLLDFGALGIICPLVNNREDVESFVKACRYSPRGSRSFGPVRASVSYGVDYYKNANDAILTMAMIETKSALDSLDEILSVEELDGVYIGPNDLGIELGQGPILDADNKVLDTAIEKIVSFSRKYNKFVGIFCGSASGCLKRKEQGCTYLTLGNDTLIFKNAIKNEFGKLKSIV